MALFTSLSKTRKHEEDTALLDISDDDASSGYESPVHFSDFSRCSQTITTFFDTSDDSDFSSEDSDNDAFSIDEDDDSSDDLDDLDNVQPTEDSLKLTSTISLVENIQYILQMPELCDVTFLVGPKRIPVYGLKSILGIRSPVFLKLFLNMSKDEMNKKKKKKKAKDCQTESNNKTQIIIDSYDVDIFRSFVMFLHCGSAILDASTVVGLLCCAVEFDIPDLKEACFEFVRKCLSSASTSIAMKETFRYGDHSAAVKLRQNILERQNEVNTMEKKPCEIRRAPIGKESEV